MSQPFLAEIRMFAISFVPRAWAACNGQLLPINQNQGLFSLLGTTYGGNGSTNFGLPNLQGRVPVHFNFSTFQRGQAGGVTTHTLSVAEMPAHQHTLQAVATGSGQRSLSGNQLGTPPFEMYGSATPAGLLAASSLANAGSGTPHNNVQPYLTVLFCIALQGVFPSST
ncbi:MAG: phage tail protein [Verrucomicrobia bacterium]|nr:phage tail protein [Verrucomicrobiota bacterium]